MSTEQQAAQGFKSKIKAECDSFAEHIKKSTDENFESDETLEQQRKELSEKLIFSWQKLKWFREWIAECESKKEKIAGELHHLYMQQFHMSVIHDK